MKRRADHHRGEHGRLVQKPEPGWPRALLTIDPRGPLHRPAIERQAPNEQKDERCRLEQVPVGMDEDGDVVTSMVVREAELPAVQQVGAALRGLGKLQRAVLDVVNEMAEAQTEGIEVQAVLAEVVRRTGREGQRNARSHAARALNELCERDDVNYEVVGDTLRVA